MFMILFYRWVRGYVLFQARGGFPERFFNLCSARGIAIWGSSIKNNTLFGKMSCADYKKIRPLAFAAKTRVNIRSRRGLMCVFAKYRHRFGIPAGAVCFFVILHLLSSVVWNVNISGCAKVSEKDVLRQLEKVGVYEGCFAKNIDASAAEQQLLINMPALSWCAVNVNGCFADIDVRETDERQMENKTSYPANIVAARGGTIVSIQAYYGVPAVRVGEAVAAGDLLVSGTMENKDGSIIYCEARASVIAETVRRLSVSVPYRQTRYEDISAPYTRCVVDLFGAEIPLFFGEVKGPCSISRETVVPCVNGRRLPLKIHKATFVNRRKFAVKIDETAARAAAERQMNELAEKQLGKIRKSRLSSTFTADKNGVTLTADFLCREDIAAPKKILING